MSSSIVNEWKLGSVGKHDNSASNSWIYLRECSLRRIPNSGQRRKCRRNHLEPPCIDRTHGGEAGVVGDRPPDARSLAFGCVSRVVLFEWGFALIRLCGS